ncbi:chromosome (plasmid) partitioning protein ParA [Vibrio variabilis]|uniref:Chromosome (Plasmid) partitioning protein ParA n=1 Tax=Vibrio variabilis TaxID=990271 RepID=A0ABQ0J6W3_9VIBR|nr:chromosome (plasmid) partitioning protein ParA [Vibrio variabilis]
MKREQTIDNLYQLAEQTQQVQADRIEIVLEERSDDHFPAMSKAMMETRSGLTRRKLDDAISKMEEGGTSSLKTMPTIILFLFKKRTCSWTQQACLSFMSASRALTISRGLSTYKTRKVVQVSQ